MHSKSLSISWDLDGDDWVNNLKAWSSLMVAMMLVASATAATLLAAPDQAETDTAEETARNDADQDKFEAFLLFPVSVVVTSVFIVLDVSVWIIGTAAVVCGRFGENVKDA